jgi:hypothetical protein
MKTTRPRNGRCEYNAMLAYTERCDQPATHILEWTLSDQSFGPDYMCAYHARVSAEQIQEVGGSPRIGNL